ncbi:TlpA family protein disulfide reductase [Spirosoma aerolatum]|uniref:TlpA family protein disulfide reductase n=1 Tax=Spirosoma aerolatum TaxID=1211326 RepID=UPI0009ACD555|nr:TlpA disulfide reductase family protein [Spirosoma aerolatum]
MLKTKVSLLYFVTTVLLGFHSVVVAQSVSFKDNDRTQFSSTKIIKESELVLLETETYSSFKQLMALFPGKIVYVDVWATWCKPCLIEFEKHQALEDVTQNKTVELLYLSIDRTNYKGKWLKTIKKYGLSGHHIIASRELQKDMWKVVHDQEDRLSIPYYFISDQTGRILLRDAPKPSQGDTLKTKLEEVILKAK